MARTTLRNGSRGTLVEELQNTLNSLASNGGSRLAALVPDGAFGRKTDERVREYQRGVPLVSDGIVGPNTWASLDGAERPEGGDGAPRRDRPKVAQPRKVTAWVKAAEVGKGLARSYPLKVETYRVPLYTLALSGTDANGVRQNQDFTVIRFGISKKTRADPAKVVGLRNAQTHVLNRAAYMGGSWQLYGNFLIHDGADNPQKTAWGAIGCIEITGKASAGSGYEDAWKEFDARVVEYSGLKNADDVSRKACFSIKLDPIAKYPPLVRV